MNTYSKVLKYISIKDVKQKHQEKIVGKIKEEVRKKEEKKHIQSLMEGKKYDWRKKLNEEMTSSGMFFTTLPATGDVDLKSLGYSEYQAVYTSGVDVGSDFGSEYLQFSGNPNEFGNRVTILNPTDTSNYTTVSISVIGGNDTGYLKSPSNNLTVYWFSPTAGGVLGSISKSNVSSTSLTSFSFTLPTEARGPGTEIGLAESGVPSVGGQQYVGKNLTSIHPVTFNSNVASWINDLLDYYPNITEQQKIYYGFAIWDALQDSYVGNWPSNAGYPSPSGGSSSTTSIGTSDQIYISNQIISAFADNHRKFATTYGVSKIGYQRRTPINIFVPLDSPEAASFIRTDPMMSNLSPKEREKKLEKMLDASDEYVEKILGKNFPGTGTRPTETIMPNSWETAQLSDSTERKIDAMLLKGLQRGDYGTGPDINKQIKNLQQNMRNNTPGGRGLQVQTGQNTQVAQYEPGGQLILEKKLKSPEEVLNKIPGYYDGKPAPLGFPIEQPPEMINGMHPDLVDGKKIANRFNRLDPQSAKAMPLTGNPEIDKKVKKARKQSK